ncbi:hypothetical protein [Ammonifex thiophilus]|uniref:Uncharacterized protein n=1 Tax=Ammonifex thiophilus TaxID=444093 RepID=A0A3D8P236_9THEO|nr:hypothetical protein [Ammonifex thiophilus]RDV80734.1 hypothetical protein DXX99_10400 [Ammonifex thiophilus]
MTRQLTPFTEGENLTFPGCAREGDLLAALLYFPEDYARYFGGSVEDYKDYLLERHFFLGDVGGEFVRVVTVPFLREEFLKSGLPDTPESHLTWALKAAKNPEKLLKLKEKVGVLPGPQMEEMFSCRVVFAAFTLPVRGMSDLFYLQGKLKAKLVRQVAKKLEEALLGGLPRFRALSRNRAFGVGLAIGNALVSDGAVEDLAFVLEDRGEIAAPGFASMNGAYHVEEAHRPVWPEEFEPDAETLLTVFLPLVFGGDITTAAVAASRVGEGKLGREEAVLLLQELRGLFGKLLPEDYPYRAKALSTLVLVPSYRIEDFLEGLLDREVRLASRFPGRPTLWVIDGGRARRVK